MLRNAELEKNAASPLSPSLLPLPDALASAAPLLLPVLELTSLALSMRLAWMGVGVGPGVLL